MIEAIPADTAATMAVPASELAANPKINRLMVLYATPSTGSQLYEITRNDSSGFIALATTWMIMFIAFWFLYSITADRPAPLIKSIMKNKYSLAVSIFRVLTFGGAIAFTAAVYELTFLGMGKIIDYGAQTHLHDLYKWLPIYNTFYYWCIAGGKLMSAVTAVRLVAAAPQASLPRWIPFVTWFLLGFPVLWAAMGIIGSNITCGDVRDPRDGLTTHGQAPCVNQGIFFIVMHSVDIAEEMAQLILTVIMFAKLISGKRPRLLAQLVISPLARIMVMQSSSWRMTELIFAFREEGTSHIFHNSTQLIISSSLQICLSVITSNATWLVPFCVYASALNHRSASTIEHYVKNRDARTLAEGLPLYRSSTQSPSSGDNDMDEKDKIITQEIAMPTQSYQPRPTSFNCLNCGKHQKYPEDTPSLPITPPVSAVLRARSESSQTSEREFHPLTLSHCQGPPPPLQTDTPADIATTDHHASDQPAEERMTEKRPRLKPAPPASQIPDDTMAKLMTFFRSDPEEHFLKEATHPSGCKVKPIGSYPVHPAVYPWIAKEQTERAANAVKRRWGAPCPLFEVQDKTDKPCSATENSVVRAISRGIDDLKPRKGPYLHMDEPASSSESGFQSIESFVGESGPAGTANRLKTANGIDMAPLRLVNDSNCDSKNGTIHNSGQEAERTSPHVHLPTTSQDNQPVHTTDPDDSDSKSVQDLATNTAPSIVPASQTRITWVPTLAEVHEEETRTKPPTPEKLHHDSQQTAKDLFLPTAQHISGCRVRETGSYRSHPGVNPRQARLEIEEANRRAKRENIRQQFAAGEKPLDVFSREVKTAREEFDAKKRAQEEATAKNVADWEAWKAGQVRIRVKMAEEVERKRDAGLPARFDGKSSPKSGGRSRTQSPADS